jgi:hypothetical protein
MNPETDCAADAAMRSWPEMTDLADLIQRIERLCGRATSEHPSARLLVEIEDLLAEGYLCALHGDHRLQGLKRRFHELVDEVDAARAAEQLQSVAREQRMVSEATQELRSRLAVMREHWIALGADRLGLA